MRKRIGRNAGIAGSALIGFATTAKVLDGISRGQTLLTLPLLFEQPWFVLLLVFGGLFLIYLAVNNGKIRAPAQMVHDQYGNIHTAPPIRIRWVFIAGGVAAACALIALGAGFAWMMFRPLPPVQAIVHWPVPPREKAQNFPTPTPTTPAPPRTTEKHPVPRLGNDPTSIAIGAGAHAGGQQSSGISQSNSGGVNVQQGTTGNNSPIINSPITIGDVPKRLSPQDMTTLISYLSRCPSKSSVQIRADQVSGATRIPEQFDEALNKSGWTMLEQGVHQYMAFFAPGKRFQGVLIRIKGDATKPDEQLSFGPSDPVACIGNSIDAFKIPSGVRRSPDQKEDLIIIDFTGGFPN